MIKCRHKVIPSTCAFCTKFKYVPVVRCTLVERKKKQDKCLTVYKEEKYTPKLS
jgi:hypothetical protein